MALGVDPAALVLLLAGRGAQVAEEGARLRLARVVGRLGRRAGGRGAGELAALAVLVWVGWCGLVDAVAVAVAVDVDVALLVVAVEVGVDAAAAAGGWVGS